MASLQDARTQFPEYAELPDATLAEVLYSQFYSDLPREEFYKRIQMTEPAAPEMPRPDGSIAGAAPAIPPDEKRGIGTRIKEGAAAGWGTRELGIPLETRTKYPGL